MTRTVLFPIAVRNLVQFIFCREFLSGHVPARQQTGWETIPSEKLAVIRDEFLAYKSENERVINEGSHRGSGLKVKW